MLQRLNEHAKERLSVGAGDVLSESQFDVSGKKGYRLSSGWTWAGVRFERS
jgi:hypothetical protein